MTKRLDNLEHKAQIRQAIIDAVSKSAMHEEKTEEAAPPGPQDWPAPETDWRAVSPEEAITLFQAAVADVRRMKDALCNWDADAPRDVMPTREYWGGIQRLMHAFTVLYSRGVAVEPPLEDIAQMGSLAGLLATGILPKPVTDVVAGDKGARRHSPRAKDDIAHAIAYIDAAKANIVQDTSFLKTVAEAFDVNEKTVSYWYRDRANIKPLSAIPMDDIAERMRNHGQLFMKMAPARKGGRKADT